MRRWYGGIKDIDIVIFCGSFGDVIVMKYNYLIKKFTDVAVCFMIVF